MRYKWQIILSVLMSITLIAQTYKDKPYIQDYADKFELNENQKGLELRQVRSDRNNVMSILSSDGLFQPWDKKIVKDSFYRPFADIKILAIDRYENQFVYLSDKAVFSNSWAGKFYAEHGLKNPTHFVIANNFTTLVAAEGELVIVQDGKPTWNKSLNNFKPIEIIFDENGKRFLILTKDALYELQCPERDLDKVYDGSNLTSLAVKDSKVFLGTTDGYLTLDGKNFK